MYRTTPLCLPNNFVVLEIGTYIGFSTLAWASAVGPEGHVTALEFSPEYAAIAEETFAKNGISNTEVIVGDARESSVDRVSSCLEKSLTRAQNPKTHLHIEGAIRSHFH